MALPSEFVVYGMPVSLQGSTRNRRRFQQSLRDEALQIWGDGPTVRDFVAVEILFWVNSGTKNIPDINNVLKPILDALKNLVYDDDDQVTDIICRKRFFGSELASPDPSPTLLGCYTATTPFVYIRLTEAPIQGL